MTEELKQAITDLQELLDNPPHDYHETEKPENLVRAQEWIRANKKDYQDPFDCAVDCAYDLDLLEWCEINGDRTFIPVWLVELAEEMMPA